MDIKEDSINVLIQTAQFAQSKGILTLQNAAIVNQAILILRPPKVEDLKENIKIISKPNE